ncbi:MAG: LA_2272 family surface repeat-containing protein [Kiritimatiellia bacterium]
MKKTLMGLCVVLACAAVSAQNAASAPGAQPAAKASTAKAAWPVWLAFNSTKDIDVAGVRFTLPYGQCESVTGFDLGLYGRCRYFEGLQVNILRNEAEDVMAGFQVGIYNSAGRADLVGLQLGLLNEARTVRGIQVGIINLAGQIEGIQVGLVNRAETTYGFQVGGVNVIRDSDLSFCPIVNIGFDVFPNY